MKTYKQLQERINMARAKMAAEEVEQIDELSTDTLKSYVKKARPDSYAQGGNPSMKKRFNRIDGVNKAHAKMQGTNEEVELEEGRMKEIAMDINSMDDKEFKAKHKKSKQEMKDSLKSEELKGDQHKIDANKNGKIDGHDFKLLRGKKKVEEEAEQVEERWSEYSKKTSKNLAAAALDVGNVATGGLLSKSKLAKKAMKWADSPDETTSKSRLKAYQARQARKTNEEVELEESDLKPYIVVHAKHGKFETHAASTYEAAKNAAAHWKTKKGTSGMDVHRADITHSTQHVG